MAINFIIIGIISVLGLSYYLLKQRYRYWKDRGVPYVEPEFPHGNLKGASQKVTAGETLVEIYKKLKGQGPLAGIYLFLKPAVLVTDLDLLKNVFVKDFQHFQDRGIFVNEKDDPLSAHLFSLEGQHWKNLRAKLSPTFTSGKMKMMHPTILQVADQFRDHLRDITSKNGTELELRELLAQFTTDVIGNVAFGIECNSMKDPNSEFRNTGRLIFKPTPWLILKNFFLLGFPELGRKLRMRLNKPQVITFFMKLLTDVVKYREENNVQRNDFMSLLLQIKNTGKLEGEKADLGKMTFEELAAQVFLFFIAGFETSSSTMTFTFYELAQNHALQDRARQEIREVMARHGGQLNYEAAMELTYIDQIINETLRKYPVVDVLFRKVTIPYKVPNTDIVLEKGQALLIPVLAFHRDPEIYPDPEKFDPDRFTKENIAARHPYAWMPFGDGPRNCVGLRFGMMQTRLGIATILNNFEVNTSSRTTIPMKFLPAGQVLTPIDGMYLSLKPLTT